MLQLVSEHQETPSHGGFGWGSVVLSQGTGDPTGSVLHPRIGRGSCNAPAGPGAPRPQGGWEMATRRVVVTRTVRVPVRIVRTVTIRIRPGR